MRRSLKHFSKSKTDSLIESHDQKPSLAQKKIVHTTILLFRFQVKASSERIVLPVKKNHKKNTALRVVKSQETANSSLSYRSAAMNNKNQNGTT